MFSESYCNFNEFRVIFKRATECPRLVICITCPNYFHLKVSAQPFFTLSKYTMHLLPSGLRARALRLSGNAKFAIIESCLNTFNTL